MDFEGKGRSVKYIRGENRGENKCKLKGKEIDLKEEGKGMKIDGMNGRKVGMGGISVV